MAKRRFRIEQIAPHLPLIWAVTEWFYWNRAANEVLKRDVDGALLEAAYDAVDWESYYGRLKGTPFYEWAVEVNAARRVELTLGTNELWGERIVLAVLPGHRRVPAESKQGKAAPGGAADRQGQLCARERGGGGRGDQGAAEAAVLTPGEAASCARWLAQVVGLGNPFQPRHAIKIAVKAGDERDLAVTAGKGDQGIVEIELTAGGTHQFNDLGI